MGVWSYFYIFPKHGDLVSFSTFLESDKDNIFDTSKKIRKTSSFTGSFFGMPLSGEVSSCNTSIFMAWPKKRNEELTPERKFEFENLIFGLAEKVGGKFAFEIAEPADDFEKNFICSAQLAYFAEEYPVKRYGVHKSSKVRVHSNFKLSSTVKNFNIFKPPNRP